jgi:XTP/dITP diphosphohydrolase
LESDLVKYKKIVLASSNPGKLEEFSALLQPLDIEVIPQSAFNINDAEETGLTFIENAIIKARHAASISGLPALADDSGLAVDALNGAPGIYSARYAGPLCNSADNIAKLLTELRDVPVENRQAEFHCVLALLASADDPVPIICHSTWRGVVLTTPRGTNGFGYDPVFYIPSLDKSSAELEPTVKNSVSHRSKALQSLITLLTESS